MSNTENLIDLFAEFAVDKDKAEKGAPLEIGGTTFKVAKINTAEALAYRNTRLQELNEKFPAEERKAENKAWTAAVDEVFIRTHAKFTLVGWDKLKFKGQVIEGYSEEVAYELMAMEEFAEVILRFAANRKNYSVMTEEEAKN
jgi:hypothetical protein